MFYLGVCALIHLFIFWLLKSVVVTAHLISWRFIFVEKIILIVILAINNRVAILILIWTKIKIILRRQVFQFPNLFEITFPIIEALPVLLEIENGCIQIIRAFFQHTKSLVAAGLVIKNYNYHISVDFFSVIGVILQNSFSFL